MLRPRAEPPSVLYLIAAFKLFKGLLLLAVALGLLSLLHRSAADEVYRWANTFRVDPDNRYICLLLVRLSNVSERQVRELDVGTFFYSGLFLTEGTGLLFRKRWAEFFTTIVTCSFIPLEVYELIRRVTFPRGLVLLLNVAIVIYLVFDLRRSAAPVSVPKTHPNRSF